MRDFEDQSRIGSPGVVGRGRARLVDSWRTLDGLRRERAVRGLSSVKCILVV